MYLDYWGFTKFPFDNVPDPEFFYLSKTHEEGLTRLLYAVERRKGCALLSGDIGCGKTTLSRVFIKRMADERFDLALISNPCVDPREFLQDVLYKFQIKEVPDTKVEILKQLNGKLTTNLKENRESIMCSKCGANMVFAKEVLDSPKDNVIYLRYICPQRTGERGCGTTKMIPFEKEPKVKY